MLTPAQPFICDEQLTTLQEAANIFSSAASHNRKQGRTIFAHEQQKRADSILEIIKQLNVERG